MRSPRKLYAVVTLLMAFWSLSTLAQTEQGRIAGVVRDQANAVIPNATVLVKNERTGEERTATSNAEGRFVVTSLKPSSFVPAGRLILARLFKRPAGTQ